VEQSVVSGLLQGVPLSVNQPQEQLSQQSHPPAKALHFAHLISARSNKTSIGVSITQTSFQILNMYLHLFPKPPSGNYKILILLY